MAAWATGEDTRQPKGGGKGRGERLQAWNLFCVYNYIYTLFASLGPLVPFLTPEDLVVAILCLRMPMNPFKVGYPTIIERCV